MHITCTLFVDKFQHLLSHEVTNDTTWEEEELMTVRGRENVLYNLSVHVYLSNYRV